MGETLHNEMSERKQVLQKVFQQYDTLSSGELSPVQVQILHGDMRIGGISFPQVLASMRYVCATERCHSSELFDLLQEMDRRYFLLQDFRWEFSFLDREQKDTITVEQARWMMQSVHGRYFSSAKWSNFIRSRPVPASGISFAEIEVMLCDIPSKAALEMEELERERLLKEKERRNAEEEAALRAERDRRRREREANKRQEEKDRQKVEEESRKRDQEEDNGTPGIVISVSEEIEVDETPREAREERRMREEERRRREEEEELERVRRLEEEERKAREQEENAYADAEHQKEAAENAEKEADNELARLKKEKEGADEKRRKELEEEEERLRLLKKESGNKRIRYQLKVAIKSRDKYQLEYSVTEFKKAKLSDDDMDLEKATKLLKQLSAKEGLHKAMSKREIEELEKAMTFVRKHGFEVQLAREMLEAGKMLNRLRRLERIRHEILELKQATVAEIRSYQSPPAIVHTVMTATFLLLGHKERETKDWKAVQALVGKTGKESLKRRCLELDATKVPLGPAKHANKLLQKFELDDVRDISAGAATFFVWATAMIEEALLNDSEKKAEGQSGKA